MNDLKVLGTEKIGTFEFTGIEGGFGKDKKAVLVKDFYSINQDDLSEEDKVKTRVMMNLLEMQLEQKQGA